MSIESIGNMEYKQYLHFLAQITASSSGVVNFKNMQIFFSWNSEKAIIKFSTLIDGSSEIIFNNKTGNRKLKWSNTEPYFEQNNQSLLLSYEVQNIPTYIEFKSLLNKFYSLVEEFNDQSMGSLPQLFR